MVLKKENACLQIATSDREDREWKMILEHRATPYTKQEVEDKPVNKIFKYQQKIRPFNSHF